MNVKEIIKQYDLEDFKKDYKNTVGNSYNLVNIESLADMEVKSININFPTKHVDITVINYDF